MLADFFGSGSLIRVLDFLLENRFWEYTKKDMAENSGISRVQFYRIWSILEKHKIVKETRKLGATSLYMTNSKSPVVKKLENLSLEIARTAGKTIIEEELKEMDDAERVSFDRTARMQQKSQISNRSR